MKYDFKRTDKDTELVQATNDMIAWVAALMPMGNYKFQSYLSTVTGQEDYPLPTDLLHLYHPVRFLKGTTSADEGYDLIQLTKTEYDQREPNPNRTSPTTGTPTHYTIWSRQVLLTPIPDASTYLIEINRGKKPTTVANDADVHNLGSEWDPVLKVGVLERLYAGIGMVEEAAYWAAQYKEMTGGPTFGQPTGFCKTLFDRERDVEGVASVGLVQNHDL